MMRQSSRTKLELGAASAGSFALAAVLGAAVSGGATRSADKRIRRLIQPKRNELTTALARGISYAGSPHNHPLLAIGLARAVRAVRRQGGGAIIAASMSATVLDKLARVVVHQKRPPRAGKHHGLDRFAYPSGHTCAITAIGLTTALEISGCVSGEVETAIWASAGIMSLATGWSRLYLDEHWIDDIVGGISAGVGIALALRLIPSAIPNR